MNEKAEHPEKGVRVIIKTEPWKGEVGTITDLQKIHADWLYKIALDNGFGTLRGYRDFKVIG